MMRRARSNAASIWRRHWNVLGISLIDERLFAFSSGLWAIAFNFDLLLHFIFSYVI